MPDCGPPTVAEVNALAEFIARADRLLVITGAGVSTESNVPDYRSPNGAYSTGFKPMTHQEFMRSEKNQSRYWARSFAGWEEFAERTVPNAAHYALADAQKRGQVWRLITQNVDRLHHAAGSEDALELHGTTHEVICVACGDARRRRRFQLELRDANPTFAEATNASISRDSDGKQTTNEGGRPRRRPDGDVELDRDRGVGDFVVPRCRACGGGPLKPRVVFFGDAVEPETHRAATAAATARTRCSSSGPPCPRSALSASSETPRAGTSRWQSSPRARRAPTRSRRSRWSAWPARRCRSSWSALAFLKRTDTDEDTRSTARDARASRARYVDDSYVRYVISHVQY